MAPLITTASSKADQGGEELLLELEALNQALQSRSHIRSRSLASYISASPLRPSELKPSLSKRPLQPRPSFKVPFRSTSVSCDRPRRLLSSSSTKQPKKEVAVLPQAEKEKGPHHYKEKGIEHFIQLENGHQHHQSRVPPYEGKGGPQHIENKDQQHHKNGFRYDQGHEQKRIWRWRPLRAISHLLLGSRCRLNVLFSLQVHRIESLPVPMNGRSLTVLWVCKGHCLQTTPSRIVNGIAVFGETLQRQCTIYSTHCSSNISSYDAKPCTLSIIAPDVDKLELARHYVDLSSLLPQDDVNSNLWWDNCHGASYELSGMADGGTLIVTFRSNLVHQSSLKAGMRSTFKKTTLLTKSLPLSKDGLPLAKASSSPCSSILHLKDNERHTLQDSFTRDDFQNATDFSSDDFSDSFEFKPPLNQLLKDNRQGEFSFSHTHFVATDDSKKTATLYDEDLPTTSPFSHTIFMYDVRAEEGSKKLPEQLNLQNPCSSSLNRPPTRSLSFEEARFLRQSKTDFDDEVDSVAEEFLNMLGIGFDAEHHNSEDDSESPRGRLLRQFENDNLFVNV